MTSPLVPSVALVVDVPCLIADSWYSGKVYVGVKNAIFQPSSPIRHICELTSVLNRHFRSSVPAILHLYTDGGPDHRLTYVSVQL